jgi:hypothetical protein
VSVEFRDERPAAQFEKYLKSGSGRAFAKRHVGPPRLRKIEHDPANPKNL